MLLITARQANCYKRTKTEKQKHQLWGFARLGQKNSFTTAEMVAAAELITGAWSEYWSCLVTGCFTYHQGWTFLLIQLHMDKRELTIAPFPKAPIRLFFPVRVRSPSSPPQPTPQFIAHSSSSCYPQKVCERACVCVCVCVQIRVDSWCAGCQPGQLLYCLFSPSSCPTATIPPTFCSQSGPRCASSAAYPCPDLIYGTRVISLGKKPSFFLFK